MTLYMIGFISYGATLVLYAANFPRLACNTRHTRNLREKYDRGEISAEVYEREESLEKNRISNISTVGASFAPQRSSLLAITLLTDSQQYRLCGNICSQPIAPAFSQKQSKS